MRRLLIATSAFVLSACAATQMTPAEQEMLDNATASSNQPATRAMRDGIETQDLLAQATFWSNEHRLNPADLEATIKLASTVRRMGNASRAVEITQATRALYPKDPYLIAEHAAALVASDRGADALPIVETGLAEAAGYARLWSLRGASLDQMGRFADARKSYNKALSITPYDPNILANMGLSYALEENYAEAAPWLERAVAIPGASDTVRRNLELVRELGGQTVGKTASAPQGQVPGLSSAGMAAGPTAQPPARRMQVFQPGQVASASDAARMAATAPTNIAPTPTVARGKPNAGPALSAGDPDALSRLARNASPRTRGAQRPQIQRQRALRPQAPRPQMQQPQMQQPQMQQPQMQRQQLQRPHGAPGPRSPFARRAVQQSGPQGAPQPNPQGFPRSAPQGGPQAYQPGGAQGYPQAYPGQANPYAQVPAGYAQPGQQGVPQGYAPQQTPQQTPQQMPQQMPQQLPQGMTQPQPRRPARLRR